jgi:hypothetical protein
MKELLEVAATLVLELSKLLVIDSFWSTLTFVIAKKVG